MLQLTGLSKSYQRGRVRAVADLNLTVQSGEIYGFLGPNGAGKTTTIKMIVGLLRPDAGTVVAEGLNVWAEPLAAKRLIGYVPDNPDLYEKITGVEYLRFLADVYGLSRLERERRVTPLLEEFGLTDAVGDLIQSYSHGMRQKLAVIGALLPDPAVLVLDEPMVGLDPRAAFLLKERLRAQAEAGKTVFFSTHVLEVAEKFCDRLGIIAQGRLLAEGTMEELRQQGKEKESLEAIFLEVTGAGTETGGESEAGAGRSMEMERAAAGTAGGQGKRAHKSESESGKGEGEGDGA